MFYSAGDLARLCVVMCPQLTARPTELNTCCVCLLQLVHPTASTVYSTLAGMPGTRYVMYIIIFSNYYIIYFRYSSLHFEFDLVTVAAADDLVQRHPREAGLGPPQPEPRLQEPQLEGEPAEGVHHNLQFDLFILFFSLIVRKNDIAPPF